MVGLQTGENRLAVPVALIHVRPRDSHQSGQGIAPPLGLLSLAAWARARFSRAFRFEVLDTFFYPLEELGRRLASLKPALVGISATTAAASWMAEVVKFTRSVLGGGPLIVAGGPHATAYPEECLAIEALDGVAIGEGEHTFGDLLELLLGQRALWAVRGLARRTRSGIEYGPPAPPVDPKDLPTPAYDLVDLEAYAGAPNPMATIVLPPHRYIPVMTSRGCPYRCTYCHRIFGTRFRDRPIPVVVDEIQGLHLRYGVRDFHIFDDIFNARPRRIAEFAREVTRRGLRLRFYFVIGLRGDRLDRHDIAALRECGTVYMALAVESGSPRVQKMIGKGLNIERLLDNVEAADAFGIFTTGFFMLGFPGETREDMEMTISVAERSRFHYAYFSTLNPFRNTDIGRELAMKGVEIGPEALSGYSMGGRNFAGVPEDEFLEIVRSAFKRFWTPRRVMAFFARHPDPGGLFASFASGETRRLLFRRAATVLGLDWGKQDGPWKRPSEISPILEWIARAGGRLAQTFCRLLVGEGSVGSSPSTSSGRLSDVKGSTSGVY